MSQESRCITKANTILRDLDGLYPGGDGIHPPFQWKWSEELVSIIPVFECIGPETKPVYDYRCPCGLNVRVHTASCSGVTVAKVRMQRVKTCGLNGEFESYINCWILCVWKAPPSKSDWIDSMGTDEDYPANGRYVPVHQGPMCVAIPPNTPPDLYEEISKLTVRKMRAHAATWRDELKKDLEKARALTIPIEDERGNEIRVPDKDARYWDILARVKERLLKYDPSATVAYTGALKNKEI